MTKTITNNLFNIYETPCCEILHAESESVLCASMQQLVKYGPDYEW